MYNDINRIVYANYKDILSLNHSPNENIRTFIDGQDLEGSIQLLSGRFSECIETMIPGSDIDEDWAADNEFILLSISNKFRIPLSEVHERVFEQTTSKIRLKEECNLSESVINTPKRE